MPLEHFSSGVVIGISDEEAGHERFEDIFRLKWERMSQATKSYKRTPAHAIVSRNAEGDGYNVTLYTPKRNLLPGTTVPMNEGAIRAEILRQHGINIA
jgi:hypothetical protein